MIKLVPRAFLSFEVHQSFDKDLFVIYDKSPGNRLRIDITRMDLENWIPALSKAEIPWTEIIAYHLKYPILERKF